jgi:hypothetical protein
MKNPPTSLGYTDFTGCHQLRGVLLQNNVVKSGNPSDGCIFPSIAFVFAEVGLCTSCSKQE